MPSEASLTISKKQLLRMMQVSLSAVLIKVSNHMPNIKNRKLKRRAKSFIKELK